MNKTFETIVNAYIEIFKDKGKTFKNFKKEIKEMLKLSDSSDSTKTIPQEVKITLDEELKTTLKNLPNETNSESSKTPKETDKFVSPSYRDINN